MNISNEQNRVVSAEFTIVPKGRSGGAFWIKAVNTYKLLTGKGFYQKIFNKSSGEACLYKFPNYFLNIALIKDPILAQKSSEYFRNDSTADGIFISEKSTITEFMRTILPEIDSEDVALTCSHESSPKFHSFLVSTLAVKNIQLQTERIQKEVDVTLDHWETLNIINLTDKTKQFTSAVIGKSFLGYDGSYEELTSAVDEIFTNLGFQSKLARWRQKFMFWNFWKNNSLTEKEKRLEDAVNTIRRAIDQVMNYESPEGYTLTLCEQMRLKTPPENEANFTEDQIRAMILTLFLAGQDTTANLLNYILLQLAQNPELQEEVLNGEMRIKDLIREGIRMFTPASLIGRITSKDLRLSAVFEDGTTRSWDISKDTVLTVAPMLMARDPNIVPGEVLDTFRPSRWRHLKESSPLKSLGWMPLGRGVHGCPGSNLAEKEIELFIKTIITRFRLTTSVKGEPEQVTNFVTHLNGKIPIEIVKR